MPPPEASFVAAGDTWHTAKWNGAEEREQTAAGVVQHHDACDLIDR